MSVGVAELDEEHKQLAAMLNELGHAVNENHGEDILEKILSELIAYKEKHFKHEEDLFHQTGYPDAQAHIQEHKELTRGIENLQAECRLGPTSLLASKVLAFVTSWLMNHLIGTDKKFTAHLNANGIH